MILWVSCMVLLVWVGSAETPVLGTSTGVAVVASPHAPHPPADQPGLFTWCWGVTSVTFYWSKQDTGPTWFQE